VLSDVVIEWIDYSPQDASTIIERQTEGGAWSTISTINMPLDGQQSFTDRGLSPDTQYCYRVTPRSAGGVQATTSPQCVVTQVAGDQGVWRVQLRVRIADVANAGTDRWVAVSLNPNPTDGIPGGSWTGINYPIDDLERKSDFTYDLSQTGIATLHDITQIGIGTNYWDDAFCLRDIQLIVNGAVAFQRVWGNTNSTCKWIAGSTNPLFVLIPKSELRASPFFAGFRSPMPNLLVGKDEIVSRLESMIGSLFWGRNDVEWRDPSDGPAVEISQHDGQSLHVKLHLVGVQDNLPDPDVEVSFDVRVEFRQLFGGGYELVFSPANSNVSVDFDWWVEVLSALLDPICVPTVAIAEGRDPFFDCITSFEDHIASELEKGFSFPSQRVQFALPQGCNIPAVRVTADASIAFSCAG
jgi:hypothetical protein